ncbi:outer membrane beta-barrel protein [Pedobacter sp. L105]|uniref:outer membrane beta-barrel protein n=1 Tax=Pedobacter sp. L105 TaxID=1641871 RepID=UPI00131C863E|nr:outer membrane beta-barrel protein [Pedobacter sp. L105]
MKKLLLSLLAVSALAFTAQAQTEKGNWTLGGAVIFDTYKLDYLPKNNTSWAVEPSIGYFVAHNIEVGTSIGYVYNKYYTNNAGGGITSYTAIKTAAFEVSPYARAYRNITDQFKFFGQLSVPLSFGNTKNSATDDGNYTKVNGNHSVGVNLSPGLAFFPSKRFGIEFAVNGIGYNTSRNNDGSGNKLGETKDFSIGANLLAPKIGVKFYL